MMMGLDRVRAIAIGLGFLFTACAASTTTTTTAENTEPPPTHHHHHRHRNDGGLASAPPAEEGSVAIGTPSDNTVASDASASPNAAVEPNALALPPSVGAASSAPATTATFGTPTVSSTGVANVRVRWTDENGGRAICEGNDARSAPFCGQCPVEPTNAEIVRAFVPFEREVLNCNPPANRDGRLPIRVQFSNAGVPLEVRYPGVQIDRHTALCVARALCRSHVPTFQSSTSMVDYEYVVLVPESTN